MLLAVITETELMTNNTITVAMEIIRLCLEFLLLSHILYLTGMIFVREIFQFNISVFHYSIVFTLQLSKKPVHVCSFTLVNVRSKVPM